MKDKVLRAVLFGPTAGMEMPKTRSQNITIPSGKDGQMARQYRYYRDDGFVLTLIEMIEKLEARLEVLEAKKR